MSIFRRNPLDKENAKLDEQLRQFRLAREVERKRTLVQALRDGETIRRGGTAGERAKARLAMRERVMADKRIRIGNRISSMGAGLDLLTAARQCEQPTVTRETIKARIGESILDGVLGPQPFAPFGFDFLVGAFGAIGQIQGMIREMWPYKPTILRYIQMLDFARWCCRVLYEECPTAKGLVKGKTNFVIRKGLKASVVHRDKGTDADAVQKQAQWFVDRFREENDYNEHEMERCRRRMIEGEAFDWIANPERPPAETAKGPGACVAAFIEPDYVRPSMRGGDRSGQEDPTVGGATGGAGGQDWSFGIHTPRHQYYRPLAYQIVWNDTEEQVIPAEQIVHAAERERGNIKRCLPPFLSAADDFIRLTVLRAALAESTRYRAGIAGVVKYEEASGASVEESDEALYGRSLDECEPASWEWRALERQGTNILELPPGRDFIFPPETSNSQAMQLVYDWHLQSVAAQFQVPSWLVSGSSEGGSFADSLTAESPSVVEFETEQAKECRWSRRAYCRELQYRVEVGQLPADFFATYDVDLQADSVITRDSKAETETAVMQVQNQLNSLKGARASLGLDPDKVQSQIEEEKVSEQGPVWDRSTAGGVEDTLDAQDAGAQTTGGKRQELEGSKEQ